MGTDRGLHHGPGVTRHSGAANPWGPNHVLERFVGLFRDDPDSATGRQQGPIHLPIRQAEWFVGELHVIGRLRSFVTSKNTNEDDRNK